MKIPCLKSLSECVSHFNAWRILFSLEETRRYLYLYVDGYYVLLSNRINRAAISRIILLESISSFILRLMIYPTRLGVNHILTAQRLGFS
jgi:hypothetical protein